MIVGAVYDREARITVKLRGSQAQELSVEAVVDTGYTAMLTLPPDQIAALDLPWQGFGRGTLADGSECLFDVYEAELIWDGVSRRILVDEADTDSLVGMGLLSGYQLTVEVCPQGKVEIAALFQ